MTGLRSEVLLEIIDAARDAIREGAFDEAALLIRAAYEIERGGDPNDVLVEVL